MTIHPGKRQLGEQINISIGSTPGSPLSAHMQVRQFSLFRHITSFPKSLKKCLTQYLMYPCQTLTFFSESTDTHKSSCSKLHNSKFPPSHTAAFLVLDTDKQNESVSTSGKQLQLSDMLTETEKLKDYNELLQDILAGIHLLQLQT